MKTRTAMLSFLLSAVLSALSATKEVVMNFDVSDYTFTTNSDGNLSISSPTLSLSFAEKDEPALPILPYTLGIPGNCTYKSSSFILSQKLIKKNVTLEINPLPLPTSSETSNSDISERSYAPGQYPAANCQYASSGNWDDMTFMYFNVIPFVYDATTKNLYFVESITLSVEYDKASDKLSKKYGNIPVEILSEASNIQELTGYLPLAASGTEVELEEGCYDYLIVTSEALKESFEPLAQWKQTKGVRSEIKTTEEIESEIEGESMQIKIKKYLKSAYSDNGVKYVLLGGDDSIIPIFYSFCKVIKGPSKDDYYCDTIPSDIFYSCFGGSFDWNADGNDIKGDLHDGVSFAASVYLTRALVSSVDGKTNLKI